MYGFDPRKYWLASKPQEQFASFAPEKADITHASFPQAPLTWQQDTPSQVPQIPQQAMQTYAPEVANPSSNYKAISKEDEAKLMKMAWGNKAKADALYPKLLQHKNDQLFLKNRREMLQDALVEAAAGTDKQKKEATMQMVKIAQFVDFIREDASKKGAIGVSNKSDDELMQQLVAKSPLGQQQAQKELEMYLNDKSDIETTLNNIFGKTQQQEQERKWFLWQSMDDIKSRLGNIIDVFGNVKWQDVVDAWGVTNYVNQKLLRLGWQLAWGVNDVVWNALQSLIQTTGADKPIWEVLNKVLNTDIWKKGVELYQKWAEQFASFEAVHPEAAQNIKDVFAIAQAIPAVKWVQAGVKSWKWVLKSAKGIISGSKEGATKTAITDIISAPETKSNIQQALKQSRIQETPAGRIKRFLVWEKGATIEPTEQIKKAADIIVKNIASPAKTESGLYKQISDVIANKSQSLKSKLQAIKVPKSTATNTTTVELKRAVKELATLKDEFLQSDIKGIEAWYKKLVNARTLDDIREARKDWDNLFSDAVKRASDVSAPTTRKANALWKKTRDIMNKYIDDTAKSIGDDTVRKEFDEMSALFKANSNIYEWIGKDILKPTDWVINSKSILWTVGWAMALWAYNKLGN